MSWSGPAGYTGSMDDHTKDAIEPSESASRHTHSLRLGLIVPSQVNCARCVEKLRAGVESIDGVVSARLDARAATLTVVHDTSRLPEAAIEAEVRRLGMDLGKGVAHAAWRVIGLDCPDCARTVEKSARQIPGVISADLNFATGVLMMEYDPADDARGAVLDVVRAAGHGVESLETAESGRIARFRLKGLDCAECATKLARGLGRLDGVETAEADFGTATLRVGYDPAATDTRRLAQAIREAGYDAEVDPRFEEPPLPPASWWLLHGHEASLIVSGVLIAVGYVLEIARVFPASAGAPSAAFVIAALVGGALTARRAWASVRARSLDMNVLMTLAVVGAIGLGDFAEAATVMFLFSIGQALESRALARTRRSIRDLMDLTPPSALVRRDGGEVELQAAEVVAGDTLVVRPGERIALDGLVRAGASAVDESPITGESVPADKQPGDEVFAGSLNTSGLLEIEVTRLAADSTLARVIFLVEEAQAQRAPLQRTVDRFTRYYTPVVIAGAVAVALGPPVLGLGALSTWVYRGLVMLVVACPCALVISTPVAIVSAITRAARDGVLIKGGTYLEVAAEVRAVAFDKTGTLTFGRPVVVEVVPLAEPDADRVLGLAAALEIGSTHPLALAVVRANHGLPTAGAVTGLIESAGRGVRGTISGREYAIGSPDFASRLGAVTPEVEADIGRIEERGATVMALVADSTALGLIALSDEVRPEAASVVDALRRGGVRHVVMLTGDNERTAAAVAAFAGVREHRSRLLPADKVGAVRELAVEYGTVAMVGDGVNDAPALAAASLGIAMGAAGSDTALETADVALMTPEISALPGLLDLGRRTVSTIRANVAFSVATKAVVLVLAAIGIAPLWLAVFADTGVSLLVTLNGLRLLRAHAA